MRQKNNLAVWLVMMGLVFMLLFYVFENRQNQQETPLKITYSDLFQMAQKGELQEVELVTATGGYKIKAKRYVVSEKGKELKSLETFAPTNNEELLKLLREKNIKHAVNPEPPPSGWEKFLNLIINWGPMLLMFWFFISMMRGMAGGAGGNMAMKLGQSKAKLLSENTNRVTFADVAGIEEAKEELKEIIEFLKDQRKFTKLGGRIPKGCLLVGAPGTGKTLLARAVAGEAGVPFFSISGSDFVEMFVGVGASRVRDLFAQGQKSAPCIIFIDEIDAVGRHRGAGLGGGHDEREQTLNQLLVEMDGFNANEGVIIMAATNRPDILDPALLRPGRFDRRVVVPRPDLKGREAILQVHTRKTPLAEDVNLATLARGTPGFAGADLENLVNEAALLAARNNKEKVDAEDFELAKDKVTMGAERKSAVISEAEKRTTAYHEGGHALVAKLLKGEVDPVHKVTIIPRGMALGLTQQLPAEDKYTYSKEYLLNRLVVLFGGRAAEELVLKITTGAGNDIEKATELAHKMVCEWGMSEKLGPMTFGKKEGEIFLGRDFTQQRDYSEYTGKEIDKEVRSIIQASYQQAKSLLEGNLKLLHKIASALLEKETLDGKELDSIIADFKIASK